MLTWLNMQSVEVMMTIGPNSEMDRVKYMAHPYETQWFMLKKMEFWSLLGGLQVEEKSRVG